MAEAKRGQETLVGIEDFGNMPYADESEIQAACADLTANWYLDGSPYSESIPSKTHAEALALGFGLRVEYFDVRPWYDGSTSDLAASFRIYMTVPADALGGPYSVFCDWADILPRGADIIPLGMIFTVACMTATINLSAIIGAPNGDGTYDVSYVASVDVEGETPDTFYWEFPASAVLTGGHTTLPYPASRFSAA